MAQGHEFVEFGINIVRIQLASHFEMSQRIGRLMRLQRQLTQVVVHHRRPGIQGKALPESVGRFRPVARRHQRQPQIVDGRQKSGIQINRATIAGDGLLKPAIMAKAQSEMIMGFGKIRLQVHRLLRVRHGSFKLPEFDQMGRNQIGRLRIIRRDGQAFAGEDVELPMLAKPHQCPAQICPRAHEIGLQQNRLFKRRLCLFLIPVGGTCRAKQVVKAVRPGKIGQKLPTGIHGLAELPCVDHRCDFIKPMSWRMIDGKILVRERRPAQHYAALCPLVGRIFADNTEKPVKSLRKLSRR
ncbi:MAG: hypothetical protein VXZ67_02865 [Pseudomonadota bacterium]|nr:hypothetical protein [Pseudomonadota bacterium]